MKTKIFVSSLISDMGIFRAAAKEAIEQLNFEAVMAEDFGALPTSPQNACLAGVRESAAVVLLLGEHYGAIQPSGLSATHEEYREARSQRPVFCFVQQGINPDSNQTAFIDEAGKWNSGLYWDKFNSPEQLRRGVTRQLHAWSLAKATGPVDEDALLKTALASLPSERRNFVQSSRGLVLAIAAGPKQAILRPSEIENQRLAEELKQASLFGPTKLFSTDKATTNKMEGHALLIEHDSGSGQILLDPEGTVVLRLPMADVAHGGVVIEEAVSEVLSKALRYASWLLEKVDPTQRLTHLVLAAKITGGSAAWRTLREHQASPNSYSMGGSGEPKAVHLMPAQRPRPALTNQANELVEDFTTLLRREWKH